MTAELVRTDAAQLEALDPAAREAAVTAYLAHARDELNRAVEATAGPDAVVQIKAEIATAAEATKQLGLSREIQQDAQEMVRRCEYALGKAIRAGQERGEIIAPGKNVHGGTFGGPANNGSTARPVTDFESPDVLSGNGCGIYAMTDGVTDEQLDTALSEARAEGNLSRANVVRKIKGESPKPSDRHELLRKTRRINSNDVVAGTVAAVAVSESALALVDYSELDRKSIGEWISSLSESIKTLRALRSRLEKELNQ